MQPPLSAGTVLQNRYRLVKLLGQGGFGRTYLAEDLGRFSERCALKEFIPSQSGDYALEKSKELFQREAAILYQIQHPQIPQFRATFEENQRLFLAQDYVEGKSYRDLLTERKLSGQTFSEPEVVQLLRQLLPVLAHIHARGIIHRDIAPDNIMLRQADQLPVLIDFGVVKEIATRLQTATQSTTVGKLGYAPSEQMQTGRAYPNSDLYALAVTAVVLLTGREPQDLYDDMNLTWHWQRYANVSPGLAQVLNKMLSYRPGDRYQSVAEVAQALQAVTNAATYPATQPPTYQPPGYQSPTYPQPSYPQAGYPQPGYSQPGYPAAHPSQTPQPDASPPPDPLSQMQTVAVGRPVPPSTTTAHTQAVGNAGRQVPNRSIPAPRQTSVWDNPLAVLAIGIGLATITGIASWAVVSALLNGSPPVATPSPTVTITPSPTVSPSPSPSPTASPSPSPSPSQPVEFDQRLNLRPGSNTTARGSLRDNQTINYLISMEAGEALTARLDGDGVIMTVLNPDRQPVDGQASQVLQWRGTAAYAGDYVVQVKPLSGISRTDYALNLSLEGVPPSPTPPPPPPPDPLPTPEPPPEVDIRTEALNLLPGESREVDSQVRVNRMRRYLVDLQSDQGLVVEIIQGDVLVDIRDPNGRSLSSASGGTLQIGPGLPQSGRYQIDVSANQTVNFVLRATAIN
ncbi:serine/threonine protein kinase [Thermoleptolyngbya sp. C42_A2020_037]|uniref:serine/threonine protein kinase n=1 Tax=Thermoleptolyngbya sp. C42_A2020_037 TaxID=2747799 RepID=UPI001A0E8D43|nr:serine/threonine protein kinase [Thermoleptolyngbya sp. C42_A2020_037]MBF2086238.1 protein kinase [Thermoleptolyngbya sp. C42_A2020_037]